MPDTTTGPRPLAEAMALLDRAVNSGRPGPAAQQLARAALALAPDSVPLLLKTALVLRQLGRPGEALELLERAAALDPGSSEAYLRLAELWRELGLHGKAEAALRVAVRLRPGWGEARFRLALTLVDTNRFAPALAEAKRACRCDPRLAPAWTLTARLHSWLGDSDAALAAAAKALELSPDDPEALTVRAAQGVLSGAAGADADLERLAALRPKDPEAAVWRAERHWRAGRPAEARAAIEAAFRFGSETVGAHVLRALCLLDLGDPLWVTEWKRVADEVPGRFGGRERRIYAAKDPAVERPALAGLLEAMRGNRSHPATVGVESGGRRRLRVANPPRAGFFDAPRQSAKGAQTLLRGGDAALVERVFDALLETSLPAGARALVLCYRGEVFLWLGDLVRARADFEGAIALRRRTKWAYVGLCGVHTLLGDYPEALRQARTAARYGAGSVLTWRGEALRRSGQSHAAAGDLRRAVELHPHRVGALLNLALAQADLGDDAAAAKGAARVRELAPALWRDAAGGAGLRASLESCLKALRGNRSSWADLYFDPEGRILTYG